MGLARSLSGVRSRVLQARGDRAGRAWVRAVVMSWREPVLRTRATPGTRSGRTRPGRCSREPGAYPRTKDRYPGAAPRALRRPDQGCIQAHVRTPVAQASVQDIIKVGHVSADYVQRLVQILVRACPRDARISGWDADCGRFSHKPRHQDLLSPNARRTLRRVAMSHRHSWVRASAGTSKFAGYAIT